VPGEFPNFILAFAWNNRESSKVLAGNACAGVRGLGDLLIEFVQLVLLVELLA